MGPRLFDMADLCDSPPPQYPEINPVLLAEQGLLHTWQPNLADWVWASWVNANWNVWCECVPSTGAGPCPPVAQFGGNVEANYNGGFKMAGRTPAPHGWTSATVTKYRGADGIADTSFVGFLFEDAAYVSVLGTPGDFASNLTPGTQSAASAYNMNSQANRDKVRYMSVWIRGGGGPGGNLNTLYTYNAAASATFQGTCQDVEVPVGPIDVWDPPDPPDAPLPPEGPESCTLDTVCSMVYAMLQELTRQGTLITLLQRYTLPFGFIPGTVHAGLTGSGSIPVNGLVGLRMDITSPLPPRQLEGNPPYLWDQGWLSIMTPDGMIDERRLTRDLQIWTPRMIQEATTVGYFLHPGVTATLMELWPQPY